MSMYLNTFNLTLATINSAEHRTFSFSGPDVNVPYSLSVFQYTSSALRSTFIVPKWQHGDKNNKAIRGGRIQ